MSKIIESITTALKNIDKRYCELSRIDYAKEELREIKEAAKFLERPFAYEFYHQWRTLLDNHDFNFGNHVIQAEVSKEYQHILETGTIPDFIIHTPNEPKENLAVIEFKLASNEKKRIYGDFDKLLKFKQFAKYQYVIEVVIGDAMQIKNTLEGIQEVDSEDGEEIIVIAFEVMDKIIKDSKIKYKMIKE